MTPFTTYHRISIIITLLLAAFTSHCTQKGAELNERTTAQETSKTQAYLVNSLGDTIPTGVPLPVLKKRISKDTLAPPRRVRLQKAPAPLEMPNNRILVDTTVKVPLKGPVKGIWLGKEGYALPDTPQMIEKKVALALQQPFEAGPFQMRNNAISNIQYLGLQEGLSSYYIYALLFDRRGHLWFGLENSMLHRYDGRHLSYLKLPEGFTKQNYAIRALLEDQAGNIWIGSRGGLAKYDGQSITYFNFPDDDLVLQAAALYQDSRGFIWIGTFFQGLLCFDGQRFIRYDKAQGLNYSAVPSVVEDSRGDIWFGTYRGGLHKLEFDDQDIGAKLSIFTKENGLPSNMITTISLDQKENLWIGTDEKGACQFDGKTFTLFSEKEHLEAKQIRYSFVSSQGDVFLGSVGHGLYKFDGKHFVNFNEPFGTNSVHSFAMAEDIAGNIWVGTGEGIHRYGVVNFNHFIFSREGIFTEPWAIEEDKQGKIWFGVNGGRVHDGFIVYDQKQFGFITKGEGLMLNSFPRFLQKDSQGNLWTGTDRTLIRLSGQDVDYFSIPPKDINFNLTFDREENKVGKAFIGSTNGLIIDTGEEYQQLIFAAKDDIAVENRVSNIALDQKEQLWMANPVKLVRYFQDSITFFTTNEGLPNDNIQALLLDHKDQLWIGTEAGLSCLVEGKFVNFLSKDGLVHEQINSLIEDHQHRIWVGTKNGLSVLAPEDFSSTPFEYSIYNFDKQDGLKDSDIYSRTALLDSKNRLWWGKTKGTMMLDLNDFKLPELAPEVHLERIEIDQQFVDYRSLVDTAYRNEFTFGTSLYKSFDSVAAFLNYPLKLNLPYTFNHLSFHFSGIDWYSPQKLRYAFRMKGLDHEWSLPQADPKIEYRNLSHGQYTLEVKAIGAARKWSEVFTYTFTIRPPWWLSWWAYTIYAILFLTALAGLFLYQRRRYQLQTRLQLEQEKADRLREMDQFKSRFYTNITHEFRTPLTVIKGMSEEIDKEKVRTLIQRNSDQLLSMVNQLLDLSKLESNSLKVNWVQADVIPYLQYLTESCHSLADSKRINLGFYAQIESLPMDFDEIKTQQILINLLSNAIKFTPEYGSVKVIAKQQQQGNQVYLQLVVQDTGRGIPEDQLEHIFDRFYQATPDGNQDARRREDSLRRLASASTEGSGIGLALVKELVHLLKGRIEVESEVGKGSQFSVWLPIHRQAPKQALSALVSSVRSSSEVPVTTDHPTQESVTAHEDLPLVLVIEDNADVTEYILACLKGTYTALTARNGREGIEKALESIPDVILSDVMMPEMDGFEVCRRLKKDRLTSHIPIILLTAKATQEDKVIGLSEGADAYLTKPFDKQELLIRLENLTALSRRLQENLAQGNTATANEHSLEQQEANFLKEIDQIIQAKLDDELFDTMQLCRAMAMSRTQLHRKLKALTGQATAQYIRRARLAKAQSLLATTNLPIGEIAFQVGYKDFSHFSKSFQKEFGKTPSEVRG